MVVSKVNKRYTNSFENVNIRNKLFKPTCTPFAFRHMPQTHKTVLFLTFKEDRAFKLPIILILRSIVSDYLTIQYLLTFTDEADEKNTAILNEISVLAMDFVKFQYDFLYEELSYLNKLKTAPWDHRKYSLLIWLILEILILMPPIFF